MASTSCIIYDFRHLISSISIAYMAILLDIRFSAAIFLF